MGEPVNIHPGEILREEYLVPLKMTPYRLAKGLGISATAVGEILAGTRSITAATALRLERFFGASAQFWMNLQTQYDLREAQNALAPALDRIQRCEWVEHAEGEFEIITPPRLDPKIPTEAAT
jgi:antitoxin HigA-1